MLAKAGFAVVRTAIQGRFLHLGHLFSRLEAHSFPLSRSPIRLVTALGLKDKAMPINLGDLFTVFARKRAF